MNKIVKILAIGIISGQAVFWGCKMVRADAIHDAGAVLAIDVLCGYQIKPVEYRKLIRDAVIETGLNDPELISQMMIDDGKKSAVAVQSYGHRGVVNFCREARKFYQDRNLFRDDNDD